MQYELKGLYLITDKRLISRENFVETVERSIQGGAQIVQLREKDTPKNELVQLGKRLLRITRKRKVPLIVNDSPILAKEIGADGVHLGEGDASIAEAREILGKNTIVGISCYGQIERGLTAERRGADYVAFGTPYNTPTKPGREPTPFDVLREAVDKIKSIPIFAIGGITPENATEVLKTGVDGIAVITSVYGSPDPKSVAEQLSSIVTSFLYSAPAY